MQQIILTFFLFYFDEYLTYIFKIKFLFKQCFFRVFASMPFIYLFYLNVSLLLLLTNKQMAQIESQYNCCYNKEINWCVD